MKGELVLEVKDWDVGWSQGREDEKEDFNLLGYLAPERCCKCWSWWGKEGRAWGGQSGWCCWHAVVLTLQVHGESSQLNPYRNDAWKSVHIVIGAGLVICHNFLAFSRLWAWFWWKRWLCYAVCLEGEVVGGGTKCRVWSSRGVTRNVRVTSPPPPANLFRTCRGWTPHPGWVQAWLCCALVHGIAPCVLFPIFGTCIPLVKSAFDRTLFSSPLGSSVIPFQLLARQRVISPSIWPGSCQKNKRKGETRHI